jgi:hypothetical protein
MQRMRKSGEVFGVEWHSRTQWTKSLRRLLRLISSSLVDIFEILEEAGRTELIVNTFDEEDKGPDD